MCKIKTKKIVALTAFILAFAIGVMFLRALQKNASRPLKQLTSICLLTQNSSFFAESSSKEYVYLTGNLYSKGSFFYFSDVNRNVCQNDNAEIIFADEQKLSIESQNLIREISRLTDDKNTARARVEIIGTLERRELVGMVQSHFILTAIQITPTGTLEVYDKSALAAEIQEPQ